MWRRPGSAGSRSARGSLERKRGRKPRAPLQTENAKLRRDNAWLADRLQKANRVIEVHGNVIMAAGAPATAAA